MGNKEGAVVLLQQVGVMADGKIHFIAGKDVDVFHLEDDDKFFTAVFKVDPFESNE